MYLTIYFNDTPLFLCDALNDRLQELLHHEDTMFFDELSSPALKSMIHEMQLPKIHAGVFLHPNLEGLKKAFWKKFKVLQAGGGLVLNEEEEILLIFRRGKWDLPKGKLDKGETMEECAIREVLEETGLEQVTISRPLPATYHVYMQDAKLVLKESHWYVMRNRGSNALVPQTEEDIEKAVWVPTYKLLDYAKNIYPSINDVLGAYLATPEQYDQSADRGM